MLSKNRYYIALIFVINMLTSCEREVDSSMLWGKTDYYTDFLFVNYEPVKMTKTICFEANDDAIGNVGNVKMGLFKQKEDGAYAPIKDEIIIYKNDEVCINNEIIITPQDKEIQLGIEFTPKADEGIHKWFLKVLDNGGFDRINEYAVEDDALPLLLEWKAEKNVIINPLKLGLNTFLAIIAIALIIWMFILKPQAYPTFKLKKLYILYDGRQVPVRLSRVHKIVCTSHSKSQGIFSKWFMGDVIYVKDNYWIPGDVVIMPKDKKSVKVRFSTQYTMIPNIVTNKQPVEMQHREKKENRVTFRVQ